MAPIKLLPHRYDVSEALAQIQSQPDVWNRHMHRTYDGDHKGVSDIWVRYRDFADFHGDASFFMEPHESTWYPVAQQLPAVLALVDQLCTDVGAKKLGGVLITKIPPGGEVKPHTDSGWHAEHYEKFAIQLIGNEQQAFCFEDAYLRPLQGESYTFRNDVLHWVTNDSDDDRMTLIICLRRNDDACT